MYVKQCLMLQKWYMYVCEKFEKLRKMNLNFEEWQVSQPGKLQVTSV